MVATTSGVQAESETAVIESISGSVVTLTTALAYAHYGASTQGLKTLGAVVHDTRAVVSKISRNLVVTTE